VTAANETTQSRDETRPVPLVMTKLHAPPGREQTVPRDRLLERLRPGPGIKVTIVAAPAGSGKTTLLGAWRELERPARPVAWLSLDEGDNDPVVLWSYVLEAFRSECPDLRVSAPPEVLGSARIMDRFLPDLVNELIAIGDAALVLDDFHRLGSGLARDSVAWFVDHAPSTLQLVLATRSDPPLPLGAMRAHGELVEIRAAELGFTTDEAEMLLNDRLVLGLEPGSVNDLVERTEGWPAGLYLAALSLQAVDDRRAFVTTFGAESRTVVDFLIGEVLEAHDTATVTLMLRCSILERLCGPLCDAVLEQEGSDDLLAGLSHSNLFLLPLDDRGTWYRFHHLFGQLLRVELEQREPGLAVTLHRRASAWHREHGSTDEAIEHALEAGAFVEARELITTTWFQYTQVARHATVVTWIERFPLEVRRQDPHLLLVAAWVYLLSGQRDASGAAIAAVERLRPFDPGPLPDGFSSIEADLAVLQGFLTWGDLRHAVERGRRAAELEGPTSPWRPVTDVASGWCLYLLGENLEADRWFAEATQPALELEQWRVAVSSLVGRSLVAEALGRTDEQSALAARATAVLQEQRLEGADTELPIALGATLESRGDLESALASFERAVAVHRDSGQPPLLALALIRQAAVMRALDREDEAQAAAEEARSAVDSCPDPGILASRLEDVERPPRTRRRNDDDTLSEREVVVLRALTGPLSEREIGRELYLSHNTIHSHTRSIYRKLGASSRAEALRHARERGLI
jgi:LuxR family maltose regulon positive regulatory protein